MAATGRTVYVSGVSFDPTGAAPAVDITKVISLDFDDSGNRITSAEDDNVYIAAQYVHSIDLTGSVVSRDTDAMKAWTAGEVGALAALLGDEDGSNTYTLAISNVIMIGVPRTQSYGAWGETTINFGAKSADGSTSAVSLTLTP